MSTHPRAGELALYEDLVLIPNLITAYYALHPDPRDATQRVSFGTSGHLGSALTESFIGTEHLARFQSEAQDLVDETIS